MSNKKPKGETSPPANIIVAYDWDQGNGASLSQMTPLHADQGEEVSVALAFLNGPGKEKRSNPRLFVRVSLDQEAPEEEQQLLRTLLQDCGINTANLKGCKVIVQADGKRRVEFDPSDLQGNPPKIPDPDKIRREFLSALSVE